MNVGSHIYFLRGASRVDSKDFGSFYLLTDVTKHNSGFFQSRQRIAKDVTGILTNAPPFFITIHSRRRDSASTGGRLILSIIKRKRAF